jgi:hypothetical protein
MRPGDGGRGVWVGRRRSTFWASRISARRPGRAGSGCGAAPSRNVVQGHLAYYAVPGNTNAVAAFRDQVTRHWYQALRRRSQRTRINWARMHPIAKRWLPRARAMHPFPEVRFAART